MYDNPVQTAAGDGRFAYQVRVRRSCPSEAGRCKDRREREHEQAVLHDLRNDLLTLVGDLSGGQLAALRLAQCFSLITLGRAKRIAASSSGHELETLVAVNTTLCST